MTPPDTWTRVAFARSRAEALNQFLAWKERTRTFPAEEDVRLNWGRYADGADYWEILYRRVDVVPETGEGAAE